MEADRRRHTRIRTRIPASLRPFITWSPGHPSNSEGIIHNLGVGGAQVFTDVLLPAHTGLVLPFNLLGGAQSDRAHGRVVEILPSGNRYLLSVVFTEVNQKLLQAIEDFVLTSTPNESQKLLL